MVCFDTGKDHIIANEVTDRRFYNDSDRCMVCGVRKGDVHRETCKLYNGLAALAVKRLETKPEDRIGDAKARKSAPLTKGLLDYFPDACLYVAHVSYVANEQHNPGEPMQWERDKSSDHADCVSRHLIDRGTFDNDKLLHSGKTAWRSLALLQLEIEELRAKGINPFEKP